ncbi:putative ech hydrogenase subunit E [Thermacetogenium phaeum DSM 12270]|jgi:ech hydrogenase subunit E|uniref:Putative ech hydrogenase subunit E n=1 Tax=Thermacetogenium phaeum (strain ATCC BAA-254 / DSM 26808 / PB) TaxID=1089553 RepID=K4LH69_THEPS|nr:nickel-dependent hydrogenase large subunit [Thermacetogenium phaeum]AFV12326.1 putative ech hydrogenase subunit E [Thermacetogenium phaeum DSM 12270]
MAPRTIAPFGPQHPVLPEPIQLKITYEDEKVVEVVPAIGYGHRGIEKACELNDYPKNIHLCERICGICSCIHGISYCEVVERLWPMEIPPRAKYLRTIFSEMSRTHSHLLWLGLLADAFGFESMFMQFWRIREKILDLMELTAGHRVTQSVSIVGGVRRDINEEQKKICEKVLMEIKKEAGDLINVLATDYTVKARTVGKGVLTKEQAIQLGCAGPHLRASGVKEDCRMQGYQAYGELGFEPIVETDGDSYARALVRARETLQAIDLQLEALSKMPEGEISVRPKGNPPANEAVFRAEQPRGEVFYYAKGNGTRNLERLRVRTPTYANIPSLLVMLPGCELADVPIIVLSIDPCISCTER